MLAFNIIGELKDLADSREYKFLTGSNFYQNYEANLNAASNGQYILACDFVSRPEFNLSLIKSVTYNGFIMLGLKHDNDASLNTPEEKFYNGTAASLDETFYQKFERRLYDLHAALASLIVTLACNEGLDILSCEMSMVINDFDDNIDFVKAELSIKDEVFTT